MSGAENSQAGVCVFNGNHSSLPSGVSSSQDSAEAWIAKHRLTGLLTWYPLDEGAYEWSSRNGYFFPEEDHQKTPEFIGRFSGAKTHFHYENGQRVA